MTLSGNSLPVPDGSGVNQEPIAKEERDLLSLSPAEAAQVFLTSETLEEWEANRKKLEPVFDKEPGSWYREVSQNTAIQKHWKQLCKADDEAKAQQVAESLGKYPGLRRALYDNQSVWRETEPQMSIQEIAVILADDKVARQAVIDFLSNVNENNLDDDAAPSLKERLAWAVVDELERRASNRP